MARRLLTMTLLSILVVFFCQCGKDKQAKGTPGEVDKVRTLTGKDGAEMVLIPAGEFQMGHAFYESPSDPYQKQMMDKELPLHTVYLDAFYMDIYEVTNAQYQKFMDATGHAAPRSIYWKDSNYNAPEQPMVGVSWYDAVAYADWAGKRLPTEAEWEKAARGGLAGKRYPWGDEDPHAGGIYRANYGSYATGTQDKVLQLEFPAVDEEPGPVDEKLQQEMDGYRYAAPVGSFAPNGYGLYDMAGNVLEWCADWYDGSYYANSPRNNPLGPDSGTDRVVRDGTWDDPSYQVHVSNRGGGKPAWNFEILGFRCVSQD